MAYGFDFLQSRACCSHEKIVVRCCCLTQMLEFNCSFLTMVKNGKKLIIRANYFICNRNVK